MQNNNTKALKSGFWYTGASFLLNAIGLLTTPVFTRLLSKAEFGAYSNFISWFSIISLVASLNLDRSFIRARFDFREDFSRYVFSCLVLSTISIGLFTVIINIAHNQFVQYTHLSRHYLNILMCYTLFNVAVQFYQVKERYDYQYKRSVMVSLGVSLSSTILSIILVVTLEDKLYGRIIGYTSPMIFTGALIYYNFGKHGKSVNIQYWKYALPICLPIIPHLLAMTVLGTVDRIMITDMCGEEANALYSLAYNCGSVITILMNSMNTAFTPWIGEKLNARAFKDIRKISSKYILIFVYLTIGIKFLMIER